MFVWCFDNVFDVESGFLWHLSNVIMTSVVPDVKLCVSCEKGWRNGILLTLELNKVRKRNLEYKILVFKLQKYETICNVFYIILRDFNIRFS